MIEACLRSVVLALSAGVLFSLAGCASTDKPTSQMIFASSALKAAERAQAEKRSPDLYRRAENTYWKASALYLRKEYGDGALAALEAKRLAEASELDAEVKDSTSNGSDQ